MKIAIVGSRELIINNFEEYLPSGTTEIVSGGAKGIDSCAAIYAKQHQIKLTEFKPNYKRYGKAAPILRNNDIINYADMILVFWNGKSNGTRYVINKCIKDNKPHTVYLYE